MKSKTKISKQVKRKTNPNIVQTILEAKKKKDWFPIAAILSGPRRKRIAINLDRIDSETKEGDTVVVPGKVLSQGEIYKKVRIAALGFSQDAKEKLLKAKCEVVSLSEEIKKNPLAKGIKILK